jgi:hypothetical protein
MGLLGATLKLQAVVRLDQIVWESPIVTVEAARSVRNALTAVRIDLHRARKKTREDEVLELLSGPSVMLGLDHEITASQALAVLDLATASGLTDE